MVRSSGISFDNAYGHIKRIVAARASATVFTRPTESTDSLDQTTETTADHTETAWLYDPQEQQVSVIAGERQTGGLNALLVADGTVDIQPDDRVTHGGVEYEVDSVVGLPDDANPQLHHVQFVRRQA